MPAFRVKSFKVLLPGIAHPKPAVRYYARIVCEGTLPIKGAQKRATYTINFLRPDSVLPNEASFPHARDGVLINSGKWEGYSFREAWQYEGMLQLLQSGHPVRVVLSNNEPSSNRIEPAPVAPKPPAGPTPDIQSWLAGNFSVESKIGWQSTTNVYQPYASWSAAERAELTVAFEEAWSRKPLGLANPPTNLNPGGAAVLSSTDARSLYLAHVARHLAVEIGGWVPWSLSELSAGDVAAMFNPLEIVGSWNSAHGGYQLDQAVIPAPPDVVDRFLLTNRIFGPTRLATIQSFLEWCRTNLMHSDDVPDDLVRFWGYDGTPPVSRILSGTVADRGFEHRWEHWTRGCPCTTEFVRWVLGMVNIPVRDRPLANQVFHHSPEFPTESKSLSHADDVHSVRSTDPSIPIEQLLVDVSQLDKWFDPGLPLIEQELKVGYRSATLEIQYLTDRLLHLNELDRAEGRSPEDSRVYQDYKTDAGYMFSLQELLDADLWGRLDEKMVGFKGIKLKKKNPGFDGPYPKKQPPGWSPPKSKKQSFVRPNQWSRGATAAGARSRT